MPTTKERARQNTALNCQEILALFSRAQVSNATGLFPSAQRDRFMQPWRGCCSTDGRRRAPPR
eukprot:6212805-Pleurochrysis_carterae.AAC.1